MPPPATACPGDPAGRAPSAPRWAGAAIFRLYGETYRRHQIVPSAHQQVMRAIEAGRTAPLGGHAAHCPSCGVERYA